MKTKILLSTMAITIVMMSLVSCKGKNAPDSPSIIDAVCDMYGKSLSKAISIAKDNGFSYIDRNENCAMGFEKEPTETDLPSTELSMCAWEGDNVNAIGYMVRFKGNNGASRITDFVKAIGETRKVNGNTLKFSEGVDSDSEYYEDFNKFLQALAKTNSESSAVWKSNNTSIELSFDSQYSEDGYTYLTIQIGGEEY